MKSIGLPETGCPEGLRGARINLLYAIENDRISPLGEENGPVSGRPCLCVAGFDRVGCVCGSLGLNKKFEQECLRGGTSRYEINDGFDFMLLHIPNDGDPLAPPETICVCLTDGLLVFVSRENPLLAAIVEELTGNGMKNLTLGKILHLFLDRLTYDDAQALEEMEQRISGLEEELMQSKQEDFTGDIIRLRKELLALKRYYEQLLEMMEELEGNENGFLDKKALQYFHLITGRVDRLYHGVLNLRDYVTQVREAYQAQIDIHLNSIMKFFTVITTIFLPLTLIVGWYGMNVKMPEYGWNWGYLFVIGLCVVITVVNIVLFRRKKWF